MSGASSSPEPRREATLRRRESHQRAGDGTLLFHRAWLPEAPNRALLLVHGYAEHSGRYEELATWLSARGVAVHAYDHRGHGRSEGRRTHVGRFDEYLDDLERMLEQVRSEHPDLPLYLVGHSMGGLITLSLLVERRPQLHGVAVSGPALSVGGASRARILFARILRRVWPTLRLGSGLDLEGLSRDPEVVRRYAEDPLVFRDMTASLAAEFVRAASRTQGRGAEIEPPLLLLHGEEDPLCAARESQAFFERVTSKGSRAHVYPGLRHEIFNEPEREGVYADLWRWIEERG